MEWKNNYSVYKASIAGVITLIVAYEKGGYKVSALGSLTRLSIKDPIKDFEQAKKEAIRLGRKLLNQAIEDIFINNQMYQIGCNYGH